MDIIKDELQDAKQFKLTTEEAKVLIDLMKEICKKDVIKLPQHGQKIEFNVKAIENNKKFIININHNNIDSKKYTFQGRTIENNIPLVRLDVTPHGVHQNYDGTKIFGTHIHIYTEENGLTNAIPFDIKNPNLYDYCISFFRKFHIMCNDSDIIYQEEI